MKIRATVAGAAGVMVALWSTLQAAGDLYLTGFPDSHFTDYDKAVERPKRVLMWAEFAFVPLFLLLRVPRIRVRTGVVGPIVALTALALIVVVQLVGVPWYFGSHLGLDHGI